MWMPINHNTLMCAVAGEEADRVEKLSIDELKSEIYEFLSNHATRNVTEVTDVHVSIWRNDPHFCGAYSFLPVHCFNEDPVMFHWLTEPVATVANNMRFRPTLHFAGEAFDFNYGGQLQGAFNSGRDVAIRVIAELNQEQVNRGLPPFQEFQMPPPDYQMVATTVTTTQVTQQRYEW